MTLIEKHKAYLTETLNQLMQEKDPNRIRYLVAELMIYLEKAHLIDKNYLNKNEDFVQSETNQALLETKNAEDLLSFLTMIYRIDYISPDSDAYLIYYRNGMLFNLLKHLISKF